MSAAETPLLPGIQTDGIHQIDYRTAMLYVTREHYLHRKCPCSVAFGLFRDGEVVGVIVYGTPSSAPLRSGVCGPEHANDVVELTRLWVRDDQPKNTASYLIGNTLKMSGKRIVVSFADTAQGHVGVVYQATNWIYTGLSAKRTDWTIRDCGKHGQTIADKYTAEEVRRLYGERFSLQPRPRKHRYVYFNANRRDKRELLRKLRYSPQPYPKATTTGGGE